MEYEKHMSNIEHSQHVGLHRLGFPKNVMITLASVEFPPNLKYSLVRLYAQYAARPFRKDKIFKAIWQMSLIRIFPIMPRLQRKVS